MTETHLGVSFHVLQPKITKKIKKPFIVDLPCTILLNVDIITHFHIISYTFNLLIVDTLLHIADGR